MASSEPAGGVFHPGELAVQERAGVRATAGRVGASIRPAMPPLAMEFVARRRFAFLAAADAAGRPWATFVAGAPGFLDPLDERRLAVAARPLAGDPLNGALVPGAEVGLLAIDFASRRRMRVNGRVETADKGGFVVATEQVYSNCPKYIQPRQPGVAVPAGELGAARRSPGLSAAQRRAVAAADTFFIASRAGGAGGGAFDLSHRGGPAGFVAVEGPRLTWGDYAGNSMFNTLGNLAADPAAALLFVDFASGDVLHLAGRAQVDWDRERAAAVPGAERLVVFTVEEAAERPAVFPWRTEG